MSEVWQIGEESLFAAWHPISLQHRPAAQSTVQPTKCPGRVRKPGMMGWRGWEESKRRNGGREPLSWREVREITVHRVRMHVQTHTASDLWSSTHSHELIVFHPYHHLRRETLFHSYLCLLITNIKENGPELARGVKNIFLFCLSFHIRHTVYFLGAIMIVNVLFCSTAGVHVVLYQDKSLTSPVHFCVNGQGNRPELMPYVLVLVLLQKVQINSNTKSINFASNFLPFFFTHWHNSGEKSSSDNLASVWCLLSWARAHFNLLSINEIIMLHLSAKADITFFRFSVQPVVWITQPAAGTSCLLIIDFFL